jgi:hypothetical protein
MKFARWLRSSKRTRDYEEAEQVRLIEMWSNHFVIKENRSCVTVRHRFGINDIESLYVNTSYATIVSYKRIHNHAWELCKMIEQERRWCN